MSSAASDSGASDASGATSSSEATNILESTISGLQSNTTYYIQGTALGDGITTSNSALSNIVTITTN